MCIIALCLVADATLLAKPRSVTDSRGHKVEISTPPQRIISTSLAGDEILFEILQKKQRLHHLVALSSLADSPKYSNIHQEAGRIQGRVKNELESTLKLRPDLAILASYNRPGTLTRMEKAKIKTFVLPVFYGLKDIAKAIRQIGDLVHASKAGEALARDFETQLARLAKDAALSSPAKNKANGKSKTKNSIIDVVGYEPSGHLSGAETTFDDIVRVAGGRNLAAASGLKGWQKFSAEKIATLEPDVVVCAGMPGDLPAAKKELLSKPGWRILIQRSRPRIVMIPGKHLSSVSHHVLQAVKRLADALGQVKR